MSPNDEPNVLLAKVLLNHDGDKFCLNCFCNFEIEEMNKKHETFCESRDYIDRNPLKKCIWIQVFVSISERFYDFKIIIVKLGDSELKLKGLTIYFKNSQSYTNKRCIGRLLFKKSFSWRKWIF